MQGQKEGWRHRGWRLEAYAGSICIHTFQICHPSTHQSLSRSFSESIAMAWTCQTSTPGLALSMVQSSGEMSSSGIWAGMPAVLSAPRYEVSSPSSCASRAAASPDVSPFSTPPLGTTCVRSWRQRMLQGCGMQELASVSSFGIK